VHVRDAEQQAYAPRLKRILVEDRPLFEDFDGDAFMTQHYRAGEDIRAILEAIEAERMALAERLRALASAEWSRTGRHPSLGERTLQSWVERSESHMQEHLTQLASYAG
jgi:DNA-binding transcriptional regulator YbjK